jgi:hypothetical protein
MVDKVRLEQYLNNGEREYVMCAAIHYDDGEDHYHQPYNIDKGVVISGWRHHNIMHSISKWMGTQQQIYEKGIKETQGFLTNKNRFLNRKETLELVKENGQLTKPIIGGVLTSEDLW